VTELIASREEMVGKLHELWLTRQAKNEAAKVDSDLTEQFKMWMGLEGEDELYDGEHGIKAFIKEVKTSTWDITTASDELILWLAREGILQVSETKYRAAQKLKDDMHLNDALSYRNEGENYQLRVEKRGN
jgi:uncharacterized protein YacL (UPF0231 family)